MTHRRQLCQVWAALALENPVKAGRSPQPENETTAEAASRDQALESGSGDPQAATSTPPPVFVGRVEIPGYGTVYGSGAFCSYPEPWDPELEALEDEMELARQLDEPDVQSGDYCFVWDERVAFGDARLHRTAPVSTGEGEPTSRAALPEGDIMCIPGVDTGTSCLRTLRRSGDRATYTVHSRLPGVILMGSSAMFGVPGLFFALSSNADLARYSAMMWVLACGCFLVGLLPVLLTGTITFECDARRLTYRQPTLLGARRTVYSYDDIAVCFCPFLLDGRIVFDDVQRQIVKHGEVAADARPFGWAIVVLLPKRRLARAVLAKSVFLEPIEEYAAMVTADLGVSVLRPPKLIRFADR